MKPQSQWHFTRILLNIPMQGETIDRSHPSELIFDWTHSWVQIHSQAQGELVRQFAKFSKMGWNFFNSCSVMKALHRVGQPLLYICSSYGSSASWNYTVVMFKMMKELKFTNKVSPTLKWSLSCTIAFNWHLFCISLLCVGRTALHLWKYLYSTEQQYFKYGMHIMPLDTWIIKILPTYWGDLT